MILIRGLTWWFTFVLMDSALGVCEKKSSKPNIIIIIADDMGWNDVGFHGSKAIKTPNIDALAFNGVILNRHYVQPSCTPSRAALLTGKYPIRTGMQGPPIGSCSKRALPIEETLLPQYLKKIGYKTHLVGKWHLGHYKSKYTPTRRGFDSFFGYYNGWIRYNDSVSDNSNNFVGYDARRNECPAKEEFIGKYATDVFTKEAVRIIKSHNSNNPLFLEVSHVAPHAGRHNLLQVKDERYVNDKFDDIKDKQRRLYAGVMDSLDQSVGKIIASLHASKLLENSIVLFMSDNGGATYDPMWLMANSASNWPLRGMKMSLLEGGVRGVAALWSPYITIKNAVSQRYFHITDWLPTLFAAAGGSELELKNIDGINQWDYLRGNNASEIPTRDEILVNIDEITGNAAIIYRDWKYVKSGVRNTFNYADTYAGYAERDSSDKNHVFIDVDTNRILKSYNHMNENRIQTKINEMELYKKLLYEADIANGGGCRDRINIVQKSGEQNSLNAICYNHECLFNIKNDPCELNNLATERQEKLNDLRNRLKAYAAHTVPQSTNDFDPKANPALWGGYWSPWMDQINLKEPNDYCVK